MDSYSDYDGYVYILETYEGYTKVGHTHRNVYERFEENNYQYEKYRFRKVYCYYFTNKPKYYEIKVHKWLHKYRITGTEIFTISPSEVKEIIEKRSKRLHKGLCSKEMMDNARCALDKFDDITKLNLDQFDKKIDKLNYIYDNYEKYEAENTEHNSKICVGIISLESSILDYRLYLIVLVCISIMLTLSYNLLSIFFWALSAYFYIRMLFKEDEIKEMSKKKRNLIQRSQLIENIEKLKVEKNNYFNKRYPNPHIRSEKKKKFEL